VSEIVLGIDLGTTNSVVAVADGGQVRVLADETGHRLVPSVVSFGDDGHIYVGEEARERRLFDAPSTVYSVKRLIGRPYESEEVRRARERFAFELAKGPTGGVVVAIRGETYTLTEISAFVLRQIRKVAEEVLGQPCSKAVITVPANFNELQRSATKAAGRVAGLDVARIINEPTAAALAYGYGKDRAEKVAVYDLGGGTFDLTLLELDADIFEVVGTAGDSFLGGDDLDLVMAEMMADRFRDSHRWDPRQDQQAFERLRAAGEWAKCQLSLRDAVELKVEELATTEDGQALDLRFTTSRAEYEAAIRPLVDRSFEVCRSAMAESGLSPGDLDSVILVGGSTRVPLVRSMVQSFFGIEPRTDIDPDLVVAQGAAIHAYAIRGRAEGPAEPLPPKKLSLSDLKQAQARRKARQAHLPKGPAFAPTAQVEAVARRPSQLPPRPTPPPPPVPDLPRSVRPPSLHPMGPPAPLPPLGVPLELDAPGEPARRGYRPSPPEGRERALSDTRVDAPRAPSADGTARDSIEIDAGYLDELEVAAPGGFATFDAPDVELELGEALPPSLPPDARLKAPPPPPGRPPGGAPAPSLAMLDAFDDEVTAEDEEAIELDLSDTLRFEGSLPPVLAFDDDEEPAALPPAPSAAEPAPEPAAPAVGASWQEGPGLELGDLELGDDDFGTATLDLGPASVRRDDATEQLVLDEAAFASAPVRPELEMGDAAPPLLMDVTPHSLGIQTAGGFCQHLIRRNAPIPAEQTRVFTTGMDGQDSVHIGFCQGEDRRYGANDPLGEVQLTGLRSARRGQIKIEVTFMIDASGTLDVKAVDLDTGKVQSTRVALLGGASDEEIEAMRRRQQAAFGAST